MFMISAIIILLGGISLTRLPVDLLPDVTYPTVSIRIGYPGVGPQEIEQLLTRPIEQTVGAVAGLEQINSTSQEGSSIVRLSFAWGTDLSEATEPGQLPAKARDYITFLEQQVGVPIRLLGVGPGRDQYVQLSA